MLQRAQPRRSLVVVLSIVLLTTGCLADDGDATGTPTPSSPIVTATIPSIAPTPTVAPTPTMPPTLERLLDPGPTAQGPEQIIFRNGDSLWTITLDGEARRLTSDMDIGPWTQTVSGTLAAFVENRTAQGEMTQVVRFVSAEGLVTGAVFGPITTSGPDATPKIIELAWAWDASALAVLRGDGSIQALVGLDDPFVDSSTPVTLVSPANGVVSNMTWGPTGDGVGYLQEGPSGRRNLMLAPRDVEPFDVLAAEGGPARTVADFCWLPGRGRIAFVEDSPVPGSRAPASIFTIVPDGSALELLVSASRFAPAATIGSMTASPDGRELAFILYAPDPRGMPKFQALWILHIDSGELREVEIEAGYVVSDTWFVAGGLLWRGVDAGAEGPGSGTTYTGVEPFILALTDAEGTTTILFQSTLVEEE